MGPRAVLFALVLALLGAAQAVTIEIQDADNLEFRPLEIPGGGETELVVITGSPVRLTVDGDRIVAEYVEFDRESRILRIVGPGNVAYENVATKGEDYLLDLSSGELNFRDVFIFTEPLDIEGVQATRLPGQIDISGGVFSPCSRCDQTVQDYRFRAERMNLYPGDRLVAFDVTVYLRELPVFFLPLMVVPLGPEERRPRFSVERGTEDERAEVALDWPYVAGANAFGTASLRYYADVDPGGGVGPAETILGGQVRESYLGGGFDHRFYTPRGRGTARLFYTPAFIEESEEGGRTRDELTLSFSYETEEALGGLQTDLLLERDDAENQRILNLTARLENTYGGFDFGYVTQTYFDLDLDPDDNSFSPSYEEPEGALRTYARVQASPEDELSFSVGPFTLTNFLVEAGLYEDYANAGNRSATRSPLTLNGSPIIRGGRLLERHTITLDTLSPLPGSSVSGSTTYTGQIYTTTNPDGENERLVDWTSLLSAEQTFPGGSFGVDFSRVILEGETPFGFDARTTPNNRTTLSAELSLTPAEWLDVSVEETYVFQDSRNENDLGAGPLETRVELFGNVDWLEATLEQSYDIQENDPGLLGATLGVRAPEDGALSGSVQLGGVYDLEQEPSGGDDTGTPVNESEVDLEASVGYGAVAALDLALGYDFNGDPDAFDDFDNSSGDSFGDGFTDDDDFDGEPRYKPLEVGVSVGTTTQDDALPSLRVFAARDLNAGVMESLGLEAGARLGPLELTAEQTFDFGDASADDSRLTLTYPDVAVLEAEGFALLPPSPVGLTPNPEDTVSYTVRLRDLTQQDLGDGLYELSYETAYGPLFSFDGGVGFQDTSLSAVVNLPTTFVSTPLGPLGFGVEFTGIIAVADAALPVTYFSNGALALTTDFFSRVAVQGGLEYLALYDEAAGGLVQQSLGLSEFGVTVRVWEDLYVSALLNDRWDFNDSTTPYPPFNFQPTLYVTLDRCCWALYAALNTETGTISLTLGYPGSEEGLTGAFNSPFILPGRENE